MTDDQSLPEVGPWARDKLERLRKYLTAYTAIMAKQPWAEGFIYIDAFAGAGRARVRHATAANEILDFGPTHDEEDPDMSSVLDGSPAVALDIDPPFTKSSTPITCGHALGRSEVGLTGRPMSI